MKKHLSMILALLILFALPVSAFAALEQVGGVYQISTEADLIEFRNGINSGAIPASSNAKLMADIKLTKLWKPIGLHVIKVLEDPDDPEDIERIISDDYSYRGTFDGNGFAVRNLTVTSADLIAVLIFGREYPSAGLFGVLSSDASVFDLSIEGVTIDVPEHQDGLFILAGAVAGVVLSGDIRNCTVQSADISAGGDAGGIVGRNVAGDIQSCTVTDGTITGNEAGGVAGVNSSTIQNCTVTVETITGDWDAGGVVGWNAAGNIQNCTVTGGTISSGWAAGGVAGWNDGTIQTCTVTGGTITGNEAGGVAGWNNGGIQNCTVLGGSIAGPYAGGVAGYHYGGTIQTCTVTGGTITGSVNAGGVAGYNYGGDVQNCAVFGVTISAECTDGAHSGAIVGVHDDGTIQNCVAMGGEKTRVSASADVATNAYAGGALGWIDASKASISYTYYPAGIVYSKDIYSAQGDKPHEWAIGNIKPGEMPADYEEVKSYDATWSADKLHSITAVIKQGVAVTIEKGKRYELDLTPLPGTLDVKTCEWTLEEGEGIVSIDANDLIVSVTGLELGTATVQCVVSGLRGAKDNPPLTLTCRVTVVEATTPTGGSSSTCNSGVGAAFFALAGLFFIGKRKK